MKEAHVIKSAKYAKYMKKEFPIRAVNKKIKAIMCVTNLILIQMYSKSYASQDSLII